MKRDQFLATIFWIALGLFVMYFSYRLGLGKFQSPGPGLMPFLLGALLCLVSLYFIITSFLGKGHEHCEKNQGRAKTHHGKIVLVVASLIIYALVLERLGYLAATLLLLFILYCAAGSKRSVAAVSSIITVLLSYFAFTYLGVVFPQGILKFLGV